MHYGALKPYASGVTVRKVKAMALSLYYALLKRFGLYHLVYGHGTRAQLRQSEILWTWCLVQEFRVLKRVG